MACVFGVRLGVVRRGALRLKEVSGRNPVSPSACKYVSKSGVERWSIKTNKYNKISKIVGFHLLHY